MDTGLIGTRAAQMPVAAPKPKHAVLDLAAVNTPRQRRILALRDVADGFSLWPLALTLGWLDIKLRYRGSLLGPFWLTLSTGAMVAGLGLLNAGLFRMAVSDYLPFIALSLVLWGFASMLVTEACLCLTQAEALIRSIRIPYALHALRTLVRNALVLGHNIVVVVVVFAIFARVPGVVGFLALPGLALWVVDALAASLLLGAVCARFRDIPPIVGSVMQIAFFMSAIIWKPEQVGGDVWWLVANPFFAIMEIVRAPLLGELPGGAVYASAVAWSGLLLILTAVFFTRARPRIAFWI